MRSSLISKGEEGMQVERKVVDKEYSPRLGTMTIYFYLYNDHLPPPLDSIQSPPWRTRKTREPPKRGNGMDDSRRDFGNLAKVSISITLSNFDSAFPLLSLPTMGDAATRASYESGFLETYATERQVGCERGMACARGWAAKE